MKRFLTISTMLVAASMATACSGNYDNRYDHPRDGWREGRNDGMRGDMSAHKEQKLQCFFDMMDTNNDGKVSRTEHKNFANRMFTEFDANKTGYLSVEELRDAKQSQWEKCKNREYSSNQTPSDYNRYSTSAGNSYDNYRTGTTNTTTTYNRSGSVNDAAYNSGTYNSTGTYTQPGGTGYGSQYGEQTNGAYDKNNSRFRE